MNDQHLTFLSRLLSECLLSMERLNVLADRKSRGKEKRFLKKISVDHVRCYRKKCEVIMFKDQSDNIYICD